MGETTIIHGWLVVPEKKKLNLEHFDLMGRESAAAIANERPSYKFRKARIVIEEDCLGPRCPFCKSLNTVYISGGGSQDADGSRGLPMMETNGQVFCNCCSRVWWD